MQNTHPPPPLHRHQELIFPTLAGYLIDSSGPQSFPILIFCCAVVNLCLFKPALVYGRRVQHALVHCGEGSADAEDATQSMIVKDDVQQ